jgi:hypothetical protein
MPLQGRATSEPMGAPGATIVTTAPAGLSIHKKTAEANLSGGHKGRQDPRWQQVISGIRRR